MRGANAFLWTAVDARRATGGDTAGDWHAGGVSIDSRTLDRGDLFVALRGPNHDGHEYVPAAFEKGAAAAVVDRDTPGEPLLRVEDTMAALGALGRYARGRAKAAGARMIAVTGSVGKTGTKEALRVALAAQGATHASAGNLNNQWGVPLSLARMPEDTRFGIFELGMNHPGELTPLSEMVVPDVAIVTAIAPAHVEYFESIDAVAEAKAEVFKGMDGGTAVLNREGTYFDLLAGRAKEYGAGRVLSYGAHPDSDVRLLASMMEAERSTVNADVEGRRINYEIALPGHHWVINSLGVLAVAHAAGADVEKAAAALAEVAPPQGRGARYHLPYKDGEIELIDDSYNASPAAMRAAFETLMLANPEDGGRRVAILGDMLELGAQSPVLHAELAKDVAERNIDLVLSCGPNMKHLHDALPASRRGAHAETSSELLPAVMETLKPGDVVCVKGSLGSQMGLIVDALRNKKNTA